MTTFSCSRKASEKLQKSFRKALACLSPRRKPGLRLCCRLPVQPLPDSRGIFYLELWSPPKMILPTSHLACRPKKQIYAVNALTSQRQNQPQENFSQASPSAVKSPPTTLLLSRPFRGCRLRDCQCCAVYSDGNSQPDWCKRLLDWAAHSRE